MTFQPVPKMARDGMDANHRRNLALCPCLICGRRPAGPPHHLRVDADGKRGHRGRIQAPDKWAVPLCERHHLACYPDSAHSADGGAGDEDAWFARWGIDGLEAARTLWRCRGALEKMVSAVERIRNDARMRLRSREGFGL